MAGLMHKIDWGPLAYVSSLRPLPVALRTSVIPQNDPLMRVRRTSTEVDGTSEDPTDYTVPAGAVSITVYATVGTVTIGGVEFTAPHTWVETAPDGGRLPELEVEAAVNSSAVVVTLSYPQAIALNTGAPLLDENGDLVEPL